MCVCACASACSFILMCERINLSADIMHASAHFSERMFSLTLLSERACFFFFFSKHLSLHAPVSVYMGVREGERERECIMERRIEASLRC